MNTSIFELFKIGIGPSSSHTVGPMRAARSFAAGLGGMAAARIQVELYGSLGLTGRGHGTDRAVILGLLGEEPDRVDPGRIDSLVRGVRESQRIALMGGRAMQFDEARDMLFRGDMVLPGHPNGMRFTAFDGAGAILRQEVYYSVGGGFIEREGQGRDSRGRCGEAAVSFFKRRGDAVARRSRGPADLGHDAGEREGAARRG